MFISTNGISTYYERTGRGFPVVLIHALGSSMRSWDPVVRALSDDYDVIAYDFRGHGRTEKALGEYSLSLMAGDLVGLLDGLGLQRACVVGVAVGAMIAQQTALDYPDRVASLVLADCSSQIDPAVAGYTEARAARVEREGMRVAVDLTIERAFAPGFAERYPDVLREFRGDFLANDPCGYARASRVVVGLNVTGRLAEVRCPTLILVGESDRLFPPETARVIQQQIRGSRLEVLPGVGHFSGIEAPGQFAAHLRAFLSAAVGDVYDGTSD